LPDLPAQTFSDLIGGYAQVRAESDRHRFTNFRVGVQINLPLRNRTAEAQLGDRWSRVNVLHAARAA